VPLVANRSLCAVRTVKAWLEASALAGGQLFRSFTFQRQMLETPIDGRDVVERLRRPNAIVRPP
jgi:hypothetical protein